MIEGRSDFLSWHFALIPDPQSFPYISGHGLKRPICFVWVTSALAVEGFVLVADAVSEHPADGLVLSADAVRRVAAG